MNIFTSSAPAVCGAFLLFSLSQSKPQGRGQSAVQSSKHLCQLAVRWLTVDKSVIKEAALAAWPLAFVALASSLISCVDLHLAGKLGADAQAAIGIGDQLIFLAVLLGTGLATGVSACVAQAVGAGAHERVQRYAKGGMILSAIIGGGAAIACAVFAEYLLPGITSASAREMTLNYVRWCGVGNLAFAVSLVQVAILRACNHGLHAVRMWAIMGLGSIVFSFVFFELPGQPLFMRLEALAAAWVIFSLAGAVYGVKLILTMDIMRSTTDSATSSSGCMAKNAPGFSVLSMLANKQAWSTMRQLLTIAGPAVLAELAWVISNLACYWVISLVPGSQRWQAAWAVNLRIEETFAGVPLVALGAATAVLVGQKIGAGKPTAAKRACTQIAFASFGLLLGIGMLLCSGAGQLSHWFSEGHGASDVQGVIYSSALFLPPVAIWMVLTGGMEGAGATARALAINACGLFIVRVPLAWFLAIGMSMGFAGVWTAVIISRLALCVLSCLAFFGNSSWLSNKKAL